MDSPPALPVADFAAARAGDAAALGRVLDSCRAYLQIVAERELAPDLRPKGGASDLVQQTFLEAQVDFRQFRGDDRDQLLSWLRTLLRNNLHNFHRHWHGTEKRDAGREVPVGGDSGLSGPVPSSPGPTPSVEAMNVERATAVRAALSRLPENYRDVLRLRYELDLPFDEVAARLGRTPAAARQLWARAVAKLETELGASS